MNTAAVPHTHNDSKQPHTHTHIHTQTHTHETSHTQNTHKHTHTRTHNASSMRKMQLGQQGHLKSDPDVGLDDLHIISNEVRTSRYTWWNFVPRNLFEQMHAKANVYFFCVVCVCVCDVLCDVCVNVCVTCV